MTPKQLQHLSGIIFIACLLSLISYCTYHISKGHILVQKSVFKVTTSSFYRLYEYIDPNKIAFMYQRGNKQTTIVHKNGQVHQSPEDPKAILEELSNKGYFIKGTYHNGIAFANTDDIVLFQWNHQLARTYFQFSEIGNRYFFEGAKPIDLVQQIRSINREYILHCRSKNYVNVLHLTSCSDSQPCGCTYFRGQSVDCSCQSAKTINRKMEEL